MPDNVTFQSNQVATPPKDTVVAADVIDGVAYQRMKLVVGDDGVVENATLDTPLPIAEYELRTLIAENQAQTIALIQILSDNMEQMLNQLKIMNMHLQTLTREEFEDEEIL